MTKEIAREIGMNLLNMNEPFIRSTKIKFTLMESSARITVAITIEEEMRISTCEHIKCIAWIPVMILAKYTIYSLFKVQYNIPTCAFMVYADNIFHDHA